METIPYARYIPVKGMYDVVVIGGGWAGVAGACAAAREGARTLLVERYGFLGGMATAGLVGPFMPFHVEETPLVQGIFQEIRDRVVKEGGSVGGSRGFDVEILKHVLYCTLRDYGVGLLLHTQLVDATREGKRVKEVILFNKSGLAAYRGKYFLDGTGDADLIALVGGEYVVGREEDGLTQAMTLMFKIANVDIDRVLAYCRARSEHFMFIEEDELISIAGFKDLVARYKEAGKFPLPQDYVFFVTTNRRDEVLVNTTRVIMKSGLKGEDLTDAEVESHAQAQAVWRMLKSEVDGFEDSYISATAPQIGIRETRRIVGEYVMTREDILGARKFDDCITHGAYPIDIHNPKGPGGELTRIPEGEYYDVPFRSLIPKGLDNVLVAGRCLSATHDAHASVRIQATCAAMGEAAGCALGMALKEQCNPRELDVKKLQEKLKGYGHVIRPDVKARTETIRRRRKK